MGDIMLFNKWSFDEIVINDVSLLPYICLKGKNSVFIPHSSSNYNKKKFRKAKCNLVERLLCSLMMNGRNSGKKIKAINIIKSTFEMINLLTKSNPIQILVDAVINSGPREDSTKIGYSGTARRQAVDVSPLRRINVALKLITTGARESAFRNIKSISECLTEELINAAKCSSNSYAIKKKDEIERVAKANR
mmetsp:Transcript_5410/g.12643  ORF Transcript_5410/g.12643 Transcript_5410/m.12643 type:complete len:192 (+) Transcript_5410:615-1190(+)